MGSGKTEFSARVWRDSRVLLKKSEGVASLTSSGAADRRNVFFLRSALDAQRFPDYPADALAYRSGYEQLGDHLASIRNSFELEVLLSEHPEVGTWILDEASFYEERLAFVVRKVSEEKNISFIFPTLVLNFRCEIFNTTARLLLEQATDVFPLTAYCEHPNCIQDSIYTYRWYDVDGYECPAPFFDPLIIIGGDRASVDPIQPNYCTRCETHHRLPAKEYTYLTLVALGEAWVHGQPDGLERELHCLAESPEKSLLAQSLRNEDEIFRNTLRIPCLAERALIYLVHERNLFDANGLDRLLESLNLDREFVALRLADNGRMISTFSKK